MFTACCSAFQFVNRALINRQSEINLTARFEIIRRPLKYLNLISVLQGLQGAILAFFKVRSTFEDNFELIYESKFMCRISKKPRSWLGSPVKKPESGLGMSSGFFLMKPQSGSTKITFNLSLNPDSGFYTGFQIRTTVNRG